MRVPPSVTCLRMGCGTPSSASNLWRATEVLSPCLALISQRPVIGPIYRKATSPATHPTNQICSAPQNSSPWLNALELRFLTSGDAIAPPEEKLKEKDFAYGIAVHPGHFLHLNVLVVRGLRAPVPLPQATGMHL